MIIPQTHGQWLPSILLSVIRQDCYAKPVGCNATVTGTDIVYLAGLQPQPVEWLRQHRLAAGRRSYLQRPQINCLVVDFAPPEDEYPAVNQARCSNNLLEHLEHLRETNDLFGNLAKSQSEGKWMSLLLKVVAEGINPVMV